MQHQNPHRIQDISVKIFSLFFLFFVLIFSSSLFFNMDSVLSFESRPDDFNAYFNFSSILIAFFVIFTLISKHLVNTVFRNSKYNNSLIEKKIFNYINLVKKTEVSNFFFYSVLFLFSGTLFYVLIDLVAMLNKEASLIPEVSYQFEKFDNYKQTIETTRVFNLISFTFFVFFTFVKPKQPTSKAFLFGLFILPSLVNIIVGNHISISTLPETVSYSNFFQPLIDFGHNVNLFFIITIGVAAILLFSHIYLGFSNSVFKSDGKSLLKYTGFLGLGYVFHLASIVIFSVAICHSPNVKLITDNDSVTTITIKGEEFSFRNSVLVAEGNDMAMEYFVESYSGRSMHNYDAYLKYMLTNYDGNKEQVIDFVSKIILRNQTEMLKNQEKGLDLIRTDGIANTDLMELIIPLIIHDHAPLFKMEDSLKALIEKDYQKAIDLYIEKNLNNKVAHNSIYTGEVVENNYGHPDFALLVRYILDHNLATLDYDLIENEELKAKTIDFMTNPENEDLMYYSVKAVDEKMINKWYYLMDVK